MKPLRDPVVSDAGGRKRPPSPSSGRVAGKGSRAAGRLLVATALVAGLVAPASYGVGVAQAADTWQIQVGGGDEPNAIDAQAFFPDPLTIHVGDTVNFQFVDVHTVTFNSGKPELPLLLPGPNPGELQFGPAAFPVGLPGQPGQPVSYDGTQQINSGAPFAGPPDAMKFSMTFTRPGTFAYVCMLHPGMRGQIAVREAGAALPETAAQVAARGQVTLSALVGKMKQDIQQVAPPPAGPFHLVTAGVGDAFGVSALRFLNGDVTVRSGEWVVWTNADPFEIHTVTFTSGATPPEFGTLRPQPAGPPLVVLPANVAGPAGGDTYTGQGYVNSGIFGDGSSYALRFNAPPGIYEYLCLVHPDMKGKITVTG